MSYTLLFDGRAIRCDDCGRTSFNPPDVSNRYCGFCNKFHDDDSRRAIPHGHAAPARPDPIDTRQPAADNPP